MAYPWFEYPVLVQPHHTDYGGIVWHGTYVAWLEEARIAYLHSRGVTFADCLAAGVDLPVVDLALRYRQSLGLGDQAVVAARLGPRRGVRLVWDYEIRCPPDTICVTARVTLAPVDPRSRKIQRRLPPLLETALAQP